MQPQQALVRGSQQGTIGRKRQVIDAARLCFRLTAATMNLRPGGTRRFPR